VKISPKYENLFKAIAGELKVDTVVITGGRDSSKSFTTSAAVTDGVARFGHRVLYTRYTLTSAHDSIIPDMNEKVDLLGYTDYFHTTKDRITSKINNGKIVFKGIKTSSGSQTANLKSLKDFSIFMVEEAEELPSFDEWDKIQLSIRATDVQALSILVLNPATMKHWIFKEFFADKGVKPGFNGVKGNVLYIHTTYLDLGKEYIAPKNWRKYEEARIIYEEVEKLDASERLKLPKRKIKKWKYYKYVVLGGWLESAEGLVYEDWTTFKDFPEEDDDCIVLYGLDWGFANDPAALCKVMIRGKKLYVKGLIYKTGLLNREFADLIKKCIEAEGDDWEDIYIVADSSEPKSITEFQRDYDLGIVGAKKGPGSILSGIKKVLNFELLVHEDSDDIHFELNHYHKIEIVNSKGETVTHVVDEDNHYCDSFRYAATLY